MNDIFRGVDEHIKESFLKFHEKHPGVYKLFQEYANQLKRAGLEHYGAKAIMERIRWHLQLEQRLEDFRINNNYASCYARLLMHRNAEFNDFFQVRSHDLKAA